MKRLAWLLTLVFAIGLVSPPAPAQLLSLNLGGSYSSTRLIVRDTLGLSGLNLTCLLLGCQVKQGIGDPTGQLFVITTPSLVNPVLFIAKLLLQPGISAIEIDQPVGTQASSTGTAPSYLSDRTAVSYYGATVWEGYVTQPAVQLIRSDAASILVELMSGDKVIASTATTSYGEFQFLFPAERQLELCFGISSQNIFWIKIPPLENIPESGMVITD